MAKESLGWGRTVAGGALMGVGAVVPFIGHEVPDPESLLDTIQIDGGIGLILVGIFLSGWGIHTNIRYIQSLER